MLKQVNLADAIPPTNARSPASTSSTSPILSDSSPTSPTHPQLREVLLLSKEYAGRQIVVEQLNAVLWSHSHSHSFLSSRTDTPSA